MGTFDIILAFLTQLLPTINKAIPPDEIRIGRFDINKPRLSQEQRVKAYDREFRRLKNHIEIKVADDVAFIDYNLTSEERGILIKNLEARIYQYRFDCAKHSPLLFPKFKRWIEAKEKEAELISASHS